MTNTDLLQAMGRIDPKLIADAAPDVPQRKRANNTWLKWGAIAACLCLIAAGAYRITIGLVSNHKIGVTIPDRGFSVITGDSDNDPQIGFWVALQAGKNIAEEDIPYSVDVSFGTHAHNLERFEVTIVSEDFEIKKSCGDVYIVDGENYSDDDFFVAHTNEPSFVDLPQKFTLSLTKKTGKDIYSGEIDIIIDEYQINNSGWARKSISLFYYGDDHIICFSAVSQQEARIIFNSLQG